MSFAIVLCKRYLIDFYKKAELHDMTKARHQLVAPFIVLGVGRVCIPVCLRSFLPINAKVQICCPLL